MASNNCALLGLKTNFGKPEPLSTASFLSLTCKLSGNFQIDIDIIIWLKIKKGILFTLFFNISQ